MNPWSPNELWRSNSIFNLWEGLSHPIFKIRKCSTFLSNAILDVLEPPSLTLIHPDSWEHRFKNSHEKFKLGNANLFRQPGVLVVVVATAGLLQLIVVHVPLLLLLVAGVQVRQQPCRILF
jgi:hypothetical protein